MTNLIFKIVLSLSVSGSLFIIALLAGKRFLKNICSRQWQYYVWLIVVLRLLVPFGPEINLMGNVYQTFDRTVTREISLSEQENLWRDADGFSASTEGASQEMQGIVEEKEGVDEEKLSEQQVTLSDAAGKPESGIVVFLNGVCWLWLMIALGMLVRKTTAYQSFVRYVAAGAKPVSDTALWEELSALKKQMGVKRRVELSVNPLLASPTLTGMFHPRIVLPDENVSQKDFRYIVLHELTHCKRWDIFYKWLVQIATCLHWFNPLVYMMGREINNACEFSCDEAVLKRMGYENAQDYGKTLLDAMAAVGKYRGSSAAVTLNGNKTLLKERLEAIMSCGEKSGAVRIMMAVLTACIILGAVFAGVYPVQADAAETKEPMADTQETSFTKALDEKENRGREEISERIGEFYQSGSMPMFQLAFGRIDEENQSVWLDRIYRDGEIAFFSASLDQLNADSPLIEHFARKAYADGSFSFFSVLADHMEADMLEEWLDRAATDQEAGFQAILFEKLDMDEEKDKWEMESDKKQTEEYRAVGVTKEGKNFYYQGQLVNIFLDMRPNSSFYTLNINPAGTVNVKILRGEDGQITGAAYLSEEEYAELFGDMASEDDEEYPRVMYVDCLVCKVRAGAGEEFAIAGLAAEGEEVIALEMVKGSGERNWYRVDKESLPEDMDISAEECYIRADLLRPERQP